MWLPTAPGVCALGWVKCREHISLLIILCIIVYVTNRAHLSLICLFVDELLDRMGKTRYIYILDHTKGYWQVLLSPSSREKTAFSTPSGHWQYQVLLSGLHGALATFQRLMDVTPSPPRIRHSLPRRCCYPLGELGRPPGAFAEGADGVEMGWPQNQPPEGSSRPDGSEVLGVQDRPGTHH